MDSQIVSFCDAGLALVPIPPINGNPTKAPRSKGWNQPRSTENPGGYSAIADDFINCKDFNFGLYHGASNTLALDLDNVELARMIFEDATDTQLQDWLENDTRVEIRSPKANRGKLLYKLPHGCTAQLRQFKYNGQVIFELRCGNCQDIVHGQHPEGGRYEFIGNPASIPEAPPVLLDILQYWDDWKPCLDSVLGVEQVPPRNAPRQLAQNENLPGRRDPIQEYNQAYTLTDVLRRNGYKEAGRDRFIRPGSESKAPGAAIMRNCTDGVERVYSHGGDCLNDGYAHDAFDCYMLLECGGEYSKALGWNPDITKHNQRLYMQEQAKSLQGPPLLNQSDIRQAECLLFPLVSASELTVKPVHVDWLLDGILEQGSLNLLFGEPGAGKSLFALEWSFCLASGIDWHEITTKQTSVVIIAGEGFSGLSRRLKALEIKYNRKAPESLFISKRPADFMDDKNIQWLADTIETTCPDPGLVIIDTMHRNMTGDENSSQDIGKFISNIDVFLKPLGAAVLVVHHSGHQSKDRSRGSSAIKAAMDGEFSSTLNNGDITLTCHKSKDFEPFKPMQFGLKPTQLDWLNQDGEPLTSVVLEYTGEASTTSKKRKLSARDDAILTSLCKAITEHGIEPSSKIKVNSGGFNTLAGQFKRIVHIDHWREMAYKTMTVDCQEESKSDALRKAFRRCRDKLFNEGHIIEHGDYAWINSE